MKSRKGFTLIELLIACFLAGLVICGIGGCLIVHGCNKGVDAVETKAEALRTERAERLYSHPPKFEVGDVVYHKATDAKLLVAKNCTSWNEVKGGWNIKVKDGGQWDKVGGFGINENEVKTSPEVQKK